jgi:hypothetical protein
VIIPHEAADDSPADAAVESRRRWLSSNAEEAQKWNLLSKIAL